MKKNLEKTPQLHIVNILESIERINSYVGEANNYLLHDPKTCDAIIRQLQKLSESAKKLPDDLKNKYPKIQWNKILGFGHILLSDYLGDIKMLNVIENFLPQLHKAMRKELKETMGKKLPELEEILR